MAFHPQFSPLSFEQANPLITGLMQGQQFGQQMQQFPLEQQYRQLINAIKGVEAEYAPAMAKEGLTKAQQENIWNPKLWQSQIGLQGAQASRMNTMTPLEAQELKLKNQYYPQETQANIDYKKAMAQFGGGGVGAKEEYLFQNLVSKDNPHLSPEQVYEASNALRQGKTTLADGTPLNPLSPAAMDSLNRLTKYGTTGTLITQGVQASQAEAEMPILKKYIDEGIAPYGTTIFNNSPQQIKDALNVKDHDAQERLGKYMASQQLLYDRAALSLKINALPAGVTIADEIKKLSYASVNEKYPTLSSEARKIASDIVAKAMEESLRARRSISTGAASVRNTNKESASEFDKNSKGTKANPIKLVIKNGKLVEE